MHEFIDIYCERTAPGFWDEPVNALTNAAFFVAAFCAWLLARRQGALTPPVIVLILLVAAIGTGSFLFHTLAVFWAMMADVIPILLFQIVFIYSYARGVIGLDRLKSAGLLGLFFVLTVIAGQVPSDWLNGSVGYAPALIFLLGLGLYHTRSGRAEPYVLLAAAALFVVSLSFRSLDMAVCAAIPLGIHYFWHLLNGAVLYLALRGLILNVARR